VVGVSARHLNLHQSGENVSVIQVPGASAHLETGVLIVVRPACGLLVQPGKHHTVETGLAAHIGANLGIDHAVHIAGSPKCDRVVQDARLSKRVTADSIWRAAQRSKETAILSGFAEWPSRIRRSTSRQLQHMARSLIQCTWRLTPRCSRVFPPICWNWHRLSGLPGVATEAVPSTIVGGQEKGGSSIVPVVKTIIRQARLQL
jgi:hypothetical protein